LRLWRIVSAKHALDKTCAGVRSTGGRWNPIGYPALYTGTTVEICALERFVHTRREQSAPLVLVSADAPYCDDLFHRPAISELPADWAALPVAAGSQEFGRAWLQEARQLVLLLPSAIVPEATIALINPAHAAYSQVKLKKVRPFAFDARM
jgi:RES domain-containing protein